MSDETLKLQRHLLGSIHLSDVEQSEEITEEERKVYCSVIYAVYPRLEKDIKQFLHQQLMFSANSAETWEQVIFGRGSFNGLSLLLEHWQKASSEHMAHAKKEDDFDEHNPLSEV